MRTKAIAALVIVAVSAGAFVIMRGENRAGAAAADCYAADNGPAQPTLCQ